MFMTMFRTECKQILKSLIYYLFVILFVLFITGQMGDAGASYSLSEPKPGLENYGAKKSQDPQDIMKKALASLLKEANHSSFSTYPMGFYKSVSLNDQELSYIQKILEECTGKTFEQLIQEMEQHSASYDWSDLEQAVMAENAFVVEPKKDLTYETFQLKMEEVCGIVGKGSSYEKKTYENNGSIPMTYEDAIEEYEDLCEEDRVTGAFMRLFCDYAGIVLALLPVFLGVSRCLRDRRVKVAEVIQSKQVSSAKILLSRYLALVTMTFLPVMVMALLMQLPIQYRAATVHVNPDVLAFLKYSVVWLLPEIMAVLAVAFLITELTDTLAAIFIQMFWAIGGLFQASTLVGDFGLKLVTRWNAFGNTGLYLQQQNELFLNKAYYLMLSAVCMFLAILIYEKKRREGVSLFGRLFQSRR